MTESTDPTDGILLVPSAILVPNELRLDIGNIPTGMIPLKGKPMLEHLTDAYADLDVEYVVAVGAGSQSVQTYLSRADQDWKVVDASTSSSLGETILMALDSFERSDLRGRTAYVNFADTLVSPLRRVTDQDIVSYQSRDRTYRWTTFEIEDGKIIKPIGKGVRVGNGRRPCFAGQFGLSNAEAFRQALREEPIESDSELDYFYRGLLSYLNTTEYSLYQPDSWLDVGHLDTYHRAKKRFLNAREFNELKSQGKNIITKESDDTTTLINEINWYQNVPTDLQPYLPRIYDYSTDLEDAYMEMEYIGYPSLSDLQLHGSHGHHIWEDIFHRLFSMWDEFQSFTVDSDEEKIKSALRSIYLQKTRRRLERLHDDELFNQFFDTRAIQVNGTEYYSINDVLKSLDEVISDSGLLACKSLSVIHGDLCLPNILYDPRSEIMKLIDPRGKFGEFDIYGDPRYDIGKLRHSFVGHYEHIINDQFEVTFDKNSEQVSYEIYTTSEQDEREDRFKSLLDSKEEINTKEIELIEALLFLSMVPLHSDSRDRQFVMLSQGIEKYAPFIS